MWPFSPHDPTCRPLFGKQWRIYRIFMRTEMTVVKITDFGLAMRILGVFALEVVPCVNNVVELCLAQPLLHSLLIELMSLTRISLTCFSSQAVLLVIQFTDPVKAVTGIQIALPRNQLVTYCSPQNVGLSISLAGAMVAACPSL